jgi:hypothetical protein
MPFDPADLWERYCAEVPDPADQSPQGAMAFACEHLLARHAQQLAEGLVSVELLNIEREVSDDLRKRNAALRHELMALTSTEVPAAQGRAERYSRPFMIFPIIQGW